MVIKLSYFSHSFVHPQVSDLICIGFFCTPVQVTSMLALWLLSQFFMPRWFLTFRWILTRNVSQFLPHQSLGTSRLVWILRWRLLIRLKLEPGPLLHALWRKERSNWQIPIFSKIIPSLVSSGPFTSSYGCFPGWFEIISSFLQMER